MTSSHVFEPHILSDRSLPFIFHHIYATASQYSCANWHINIEILYCADGAGEIICDARYLPFTKGDIIVINSELLHKVITDSFVEYYCLIIENDFFEENGLLPDRMYFSEIVRDKAAQTAFRNIISAYEADKNLRIPEIRHAVLGLIIYLYKCHAQYRDATKNAPDMNAKHMKEVTLYIKRHYPEKLTLEKIAGQTNISRYYLAHEFKRFTGQTVFQYLNAVRCNEAKRLIKAGASISAAALSTGFENMSYFSRTYKKYMSVLPSEEK